jgi:tetratricopeptide (TPR) repeat protein
VLDTERDNIRTAVEWALQRGRIDDAVAIVAGFAYGWYISGAVNEGRTLLDAVLASDGATEAEPLAVAHAWAAWLTQFGSGASDEVVAHAERAVELARGTSSRVFSLAAVLAALLRAFRGLTEPAVSLTDEAVDVLERSPDRWGQAWLDWARSGLVLKVGDPEGALALLRRSFAGFDAEGDRWGAAIASMRLSELAEGRGDDEDARAHATSAYDTVMAFGARTFNASTLATRLGGLAALEGRFDEAEEWHEIALTRAREGAYTGALAQAFSGRAHTAFRRGKLDEAEAGHREALAAYESSGSVEGVAASLASLGFIATARGDQPAAVDLHLRSLREAARGKDRRAIALALEGLAGATAGLGDAGRAAVLLGAAEEVRRTGGGPLPTAQEPAVDRTANLIASVLTAAEIDRARREGAGTCEGLVDELLSEGRTPVG